nr:MAG: hypothetical protein [Marsupenaeus japonicus pemonivirus]
MDWRPPPLRLPDIIKTPPNTTAADIGLVQRDARLYEAKEKLNPTEMCLMPPPPTPMTCHQMESGETKTHFLMKIPSSIVVKQPPQAKSEVLNVLMADVSGSMCSYWKEIVSAWNNHVAQKLFGTTEIFVFGSRLRHVRSGSSLELGDFTSGQTDLTSALKTIVETVYDCRQGYVRVFIVTDGDHNVDNVSPDSVIKLMREPKGKVCDVYLLGIGCEFPVKYSIDIRSRLHNGTSNIPTIFWAKIPSDVNEQMQAIGNNIDNGSDSIINISAPGYKLPGTNPIQDFHASEWVYFPEDPEKDEQLLKFYHEKCSGRLILERSMVTPQVLLEIFRQWNGVAIQYHNNGVRIPPDLLPFMERTFNTSLQNGPEGQSVAARLARVHLKTAVVEFKTTLNKVKNILTVGKYKDDLQLASDVLLTTVSAGKYQAKSLQLKGHSDAEFESDRREFQRVYAENKASLKALTVTPDDCCRITMTSTLSDLQDDDFLQMLALNKYDFLKQFTMSGIPVLSPTRDSISLNPWSYNIVRILNPPYDIMSQVALENCATSMAPGDRNKDVKLKDDDDNTHFNAVIPVFNPEAAKAMEYLVKTRLYAICATFAILKNPHIIEYDAHMAALGTCWVRILYEHQEIPRPEHIRLREESIVATALLYMKRKDYVGYCKLLREDTPRALMTRSTVKINDREVRCESLIKPVFMLHLMKLSENIDVGELSKIMRLILLEFVGRNMSRIDSSKKEDTPYTDFFTEARRKEDGPKDLLRDSIRTIGEDIVGSGAFRLDKFYTLEQVQKAARRETRTKLITLEKDLVPRIRVRVDKVERLYNASLAGAVSWHTLKVFARGVGLSEDTIEGLFGEKSVFIYTRHALQYKSSRERLNAKIDSYEDAFGFVSNKVALENCAYLGMTLTRELTNYLQNSWLNAYAQAHSEVIKPMNREEIIAEASIRGVQVTDETFDRVYRKYRPHLGLLSNACQCLRCPYFLLPNKRYNQHAVVERHGAATLFPHGFHQAAYENRDADVKTAIRGFQNGNYRKHKGQGEPLPNTVIDPLVQDMEQLRLLYSKKK